MIVLDASAGVALLLNAPVHGRRVRARLSESDGAIHVPDVFDLEVLNALRRTVRRGEVSAQRAELALTRLSSLTLTRHAHWPFMRRIWKLRDAVTAYDAAYLALAEAIEARVLTLDSGMARVPGVRAVVELMS